MKHLRIAAVAALTAFGGVFASAGNTAPAGLVTGAPAVRTLATPAPEASVEKTYYYRRYWHRRHYWHRYYYRPYYHRWHWHRYYYRPYYHRWHRWHRYYY